MHMEDSPVQIVNDKLTRLYQQFREEEIAPQGQSLFHYTDADGVVKIVESGILRASDADFLNDSSEPSHAIEVLKSALWGVFNDYKNSIGGSWLHNVYEEYIAPTYEREGPRVYVFCMSEHDDRLSQWRGYGRSCAGYALGLSGDSLYQWTKSDLTRGRFIFKVIYGHEKQEQEATDAFKKVVDTAQQCCRKADDCREGIKDRVRSALFSEFYRLRAKFKHPAFLEESEWRVVQFAGVSEYAGFRTTGGRIVPFVEMNLGKLPLSRVTFGAIQSPDYEDRALRLLLRSRYPTCEIQRSVIPYRD